MSKVEIHTLAWPNTEPRIVSGHTDVTTKLDLRVAYTIHQADHGLWMDAVMSQSRADVVGFLDVDCVPTSRETVDKAIAWAAENKSFVGIAQVSNHIPPASHIYAAPAFFFIWRETWEQLGKPTFAATPHSDVAENVSYAAELARIPYKTLFPVAYTEAPAEGAWRLHTYGHYGIGTYFESGVYHLYQSRMQKNIDLFCHACVTVMDSDFHVLPQDLGANIDARNR